MARGNLRRGAIAVVIATALFVFCMWAGLGKNPTRIYYDGWQNATITVAFYRLFAALVFWLFGRTSTNATRRALLSRERVWITGDHGVLR